MNQRTHTWLAIRAIALLEDEGEVPDLVKILKPQVAASAIGSWIPDLQDTKIASGDIDNHIFKLEPWNGANKQRYVLSKKELLNNLGPSRQMGTFIEGRAHWLDSGWWSQSYKATPRPGQHLPNRCMALTTMLRDLLILGDSKVAKLVPGTVSFAHTLDPYARARREEVATYFFMLSHFVADSCQPCHCDARLLYGYSKGVHKEMEAHWSKLVGTYFNKDRIIGSNASTTSILNTARAVATKFGISFSDFVPELRARDTWEEMVMVCRASFAISNILVPASQLGFGSKKLTKYDDVFDVAIDPTLEADVDNAIMHDAVLNIAIVWKEVWRAFDTNGSN